jgi:hypothetical protein
VRKKMIVKGKAYEENIVLNKNELAKCFAPRKYEIKEAMAELRWNKELPLKNACVNSLQQNNNRHNILCIYDNYILNYPKNTVCKFSFSESRSFISSALIWKSNTWLFSMSRSSCMDLGITTRLCCKLQRIRSWAGVLLPYFFATAKIVGWLSLLPLVNGL